MKRCIPFAALLLLSVLGCRQPPAQNPTPPEPDAGIDQPVDPDEPVDPVEPADPTPEPLEPTAEE